MKNILVLCALLLWANVVVAAPHRVHVVASGPESDAILSALKARLNATERYQITENFDEDLLLSVVCLSMETDRLKGVVCSYTILYSPTSTPLSYLIIGDEGLVKDPERARIGELIFQRFVEATTETEIQKIEERFKETVTYFCSFPINRDVCKTK